MCLRKEGKRDMSLAVRGIKGVTLLRLRLKEGVFLPVAAQGKGSEL